ncbi:MAG: S41 family peptidase [Phycisphaerales bacterium]|nr:S41 family peptidase [Phycisphaerales bacterium]
MKIRHACYAASLLVIATTVGAQQGEQGWSSNVWEAAIDGDRARVDTLLQVGPDGLGTADDRAAFRSRYELWMTHQANTKEAMEARRNEAAQDMQSALAEDRLLDALRSAVEYQTLSEDYDEVLKQELVIEVITKAEATLPKVIADRDWLYGQEILFRLRTLYEDTSARDRWDDCDRRIDANSQRLGLLRRYARQRLYDLYVKRNDRLGEDPPDAFNPQLADRWRNEVESIDRAMVRDAFDTSAAEHISSEGWPPLYEGGFQSLDVFGHMPSLSMTFPHMADAGRVAEWDARLDHLQADALVRIKDGESSGKVATIVFNELDRINDETLDVPDSVLWREFGDGAMSELDPYTQIIWPYDIEQFNRQMEGKFIGVGIMISEDEVGDIKVVYPLEGKPAQAAGVQPDDIIVTVDGQTTAGWTVQDAVHHITGPRFTWVKLGVMREGADGPIDIRIQRDLIKMYSVKGWRREARDEHGDDVWDWYIDRDSGIAYVKLTQFNEDTYMDLGRALEDMHAVSAPRGLILDLRYNPGGLLTSAYQISDLFVGEGAIVTGEDKNGQQSFDLPAKRHTTLLGDLPTVVLINQGSASASEIVSGCLQAHEAGLIIGERSFGKGSVQTVHPVRGDADAKLKCTTQYYRLPKGVTGEQGRLVDKEVAKEFKRADWGVIPDIEVTMNADQIEEALTLRLEADRLPGDPPRSVAEEGAAETTEVVQPDVDELVGRGLDPQLELALLILQARALAADKDESQRALLDP